MKHLIVVFIVRKLLKLLFTILNSVLFMRAHWRNTSLIFFLATDVLLDCWLTSILWTSYVNAVMYHTFLTATWATKRLWAKVYQTSYSMVFINMPHPWLHLFIQPLFSLWHSCLIYFHFILFCGMYFWKCLTFFLEQGGAYINK